MGGVRQGGVRPRRTRGRRGPSVEGGRSPTRTEDPRREGTTRFSDGDGPSERTTRLHWRPWSLRFPSLYPTPDPGRRCPRGRFGSSVGRTFTSGVEGTPGTRSATVSLGAESVETYPCRRRATTLRVSVRAPPGSAGVGDVWMPLS